MSGVRRFLVTAPWEAKMATWEATAAFSNWLDGRDNGDRETWLVTVFNTDADAFFQAARDTGATVEEVEGGGDTESYVLRVGEPGSGWEGRKEASDD